ncbi:MAG: beta galactosidase jelly roll domain-containing protein [Acidobacteriia bacterium]|nr:beta galactosidase jelly roll domain-containing protein [Terriglobia bacterium]
MDRRVFLKNASTILASATLSASPRGGALWADAVPASARGRLVLPLNRNWRYSRQAVEGFQAREFDDSRFERVTVPHTNLRLPWHSFDDKAYEFVSAYRRRFKLPPEAKGRHVFADFEGVMTASTVWINGQRLGEYKGGYTPFSFDLTPHLDWDGENVLAVAVDSTERSDIPPFGGQIDYLTFGGIYREVSLRIVPGSFLENIFAKPKDVLSDHPSVEVACFVATLEKGREPLTLEAELRDGDRVIARAEREIPAPEVSPEAVSHSLELTGLGKVKLWDLTDPHLYTVVARLRKGTELSDEDTRRIGFREAWFTEEGFKLNGRVVKLRGLNRHQTFPFVGQAMPQRVQRRDAVILKRELKCNLVRTSHYPQSRHFLDCCDEIGLLVLEEIPGWQHIGDEAWKVLAIDNVGRMIRRDWNHPSIILWGVRINESKDDHDFYTRTNALAHSLDPTRQTGGIRYFQASEFLEDVFTMNDFGFPLKPPNHPRYLNTEFCGHTFPTKSFDNVTRLMEHTRRHARVHNQLASSPSYAGGIGWCAFDYDTHGDFGSGDRICYHGVSDIFREPKPAAYFYKSQCDPQEEIVLEPAFPWSRGDDLEWLNRVVVCSNCDHLKFFIDDRLIAEADPDHAEFGNLPHPLFQANLYRADREWGDLRIEGYLQGKKVITKTCSGKGTDQKFALAADDTTLVADGADTTRVVFRVTDEFGNVRPFSTAAIALEIEGPAELLGENPFALSGGVGAVWIRAQETPGTVVLRAKHPTLGAQELRFEIGPATPEPA